MKYYVAKNGASIGPFSVEEIHVKLTTGELHTNDQCVADDGSTTWQPIARRLANELPLLAAAPMPQAGGMMLPPGGRPKQGGGFAEFILLRRMLTPTFIQIIYIIGIGVILLSWFISTCVALFSSSRGSAYSPYGYGYSGPPTFVIVLGLFVGLFASLILWRVYCELLIVIFRIHDFLRDIRDAQTARGPAGT